MQTDITTHRLAYFILVMGLALSVAIWLISGHNMMVRRLVLLSLMIWYPLWGYLVHRRVGQNSRSLMMEYVAVSTLACGLVFLLTWF